MMKKMLLGLVCATALIASCGGSTSPEQSAINSSAADLDDILNYIWDTCVAFPCDCPGGGSVDYDGITYTATNCQSSNGESFTGTVEVDGDSVTFNFAVFGECTAVSGTVTGIAEDDCSGTITGACAAASVTCSMTSDCEKCNI
jgi:hypothetical protein